MLLDSQKQIRSRSYIQIPASKTLDLQRECTKEDREYKSDVFGIYEHESTICPNMPVREMIYFSACVERWIKGYMTFVHYVREYQRIDGYEKLRYSIEER
jgi:hypothetical protein